MEGIKMKANMKYRISIFVCLAALMMSGTATAKVKKNERDLILVTHLDLSKTGEKKFWDKVYTFIESQGIRTAKKHLEDHYRKVHVIQTKPSDNKKKATLEDVVSLFKKVTDRKKTKAVDAIWMTHGLGGGKIELQASSGNGNKKYSVLNHIAPAIEQAIGSNGQKKLRALYSTACFGKSAIDGWLKVGFKVASGGRKVYTDSASSQPKFLKSWKKGETFKKSVDNANKAQKLDMWDKLVALSKRYDKSELDSFREMKGAGCLTIESNPTKKCGGEK
jgi:hypothetical protein